MIRIGIFLLFGFVSGGMAQMVTPEIDVPGKPFSYISHPTDQMGWLYNPCGTEITPEGYLYTGYGELMFFVGQNQRPVNQRLRTLYKDYLPIYQYEVEEDGCVYAFQMFASPLNESEPTSNLINFIRVRVINPGEAARRGHFGVALRYSNNDGRHRYKRSSRNRTIGAYWHDSEPFNPNWSYTFERNELYRDGHLMLMFPDARQHPDWQIRTRPVQSGEAARPEQPAGAVHFDFELAAGETQTLDFIMPYRPVAKSSPDLPKLHALRFDERLSSAMAFWEQQVSRGMQIHLPEEKVVNAFKTNLIYDLMALDDVDGHAVQTVNLLHYHAFWLRDASFIVRMYDLTGYSDIAERCLEFFLRWQQPDGNFVSQGGQFDGWGQTLWAFGQHYELTRDREFARRVYPAVKKAVDWLKKARREDEFRIMPKTRPGDNELITGHVTGHNFWALLGLRKAIVLAEALDETGDAREFQEEYDAFYRDFMQRLDEVIQMTGGYIPPGLDQFGGQDWGNLLSVYPCQVLPPWDARVSATQVMARQKFREGLMTYDDQKFLHNYITTNITQTSLVRGEQREVLQDLYSILVHTTSTHGGFEFSVTPWADRDFRHNLTPHGWFAAKYRNLIRNILVREDGRELHLFSAMSPAWLKNGVAIGAEKAPTEFGLISFELIPDDSGAVLTWQADFHQPPQAVVVHIPWFVVLTGVEIGGRRFTLAEHGGLNRPELPKLGTDRVVLPPDGSPVRLFWNRNSEPDEYSYEFFVEKFKMEYGRKAAK